MKAVLITHSQTVRIIIEGDEPTEQEYEQAFIKAQEVMSMNGSSDSLAECQEDEDMPFGTMPLDKKPELGCADIQPVNVLKEYLQYVEGKIFINEVPIGFEDWAFLEIEADSPVSKTITIL